jgi:phenylacetic acid degradation operon negative regulatory protein
MAVTPTARSLVLDLLSTARGHTMPVRALVGAGALFGLSGNSVRVALARLCSRGRVERDARGRYRLSAGARAVQRHVAAWSQLEQRMAPWRGGWIGLHTAGLRPLRGALLRQRRRALDFFGFRALAPDLWVRPDNLEGGVSDLRPRLYALGLPVDAPIFAMRDLDSESETRVRGLWDVRALCRGYREGRDALLRSAERLRSLTPERALVESFRVGGRALRQLAFDPLLPESIVPVAPRREFVDALRRYDRIGRAHWRSFMKGQGVPGLESPLRVHMIDLGEPRPTAAGSQP